MTEDARHLAARVLDTFESREHERALRGGAPATPTDGPVTDPPEPVNSQLVVSESEPDRVDADRVQHSDQVTTHREPDSLRRQRGTAPTLTVAAREEGQEHGPRDRQPQRDGVNADDPEAIRQARLRRWQAVDPRERRT